MVSRMLGIIALFFMPFFYEEKDKEQEKDCKDCDKNLWDRSTIYLDSLKKESMKVVIDNKLQVDSLGNVIEIKDGIIKVQGSKINSLKNELQVKPKEIIIRDTVVIKETKSFWGKTKTDTINKNFNN